MISINKGPSQKLKAVQYANHSGSEFSIIEVKSAKPSFHQSYKGVNVNYASSTSNPLASNVRTPER